MGAASLLPVIGVALGIVLAVYAAFLLWQRRQKWGLKPRYIRLMEQCIAYLRGLEVVAKLKIVVSYFQIVVTFPAIYGNVFSDVYAHVMGSLNWLAFDWIEFGPPFACMGTYRSSLWMKGLGPFLVLLLVVVAGAIASALRLAHEHRRHLSSKELRSSMVRGAIAMLPVTFIALFAAVPGVSNRLFLTFQYTDCESPPSKLRMAHGYLHEHEHV